MIEQVKSFKKSVSENGQVFEFEENKNIVCVRAKINKTAGGASKGTLTIRYALNNVTTDLIPFGTAEVSENGTVEVKTNTPLAASHIYVSVSDKCFEISDITIFENVSTGQGRYYPAHFDTDLKENYFIDKIKVFTSMGYSHYSVYTSMDGRDYTLVGKKEDNLPSDLENGDQFNAGGIEARIIRVYIEYNSASPDALFDRVEFDGKKSGSPVRMRPEVNIPEFKDSVYNVKPTEKDTYDEVYGIIARRIGTAYTDWFDLKLAKNPNGTDYDFFEISQENNKILITGNDGVSLATGVNHYLKYFCKVNISQLGDNAKMPSSIPAVPKTIHKETKAKNRYAYNYCTMSYTMAFWGEKEWRDELDWLALNGVNLVLDTTAHEETLRRFLKSLGYSHEEAVKFVAGPAYYAWAYMSNLSGFGGPVHDSWFTDRTELARKNHLSMQKLGMSPVLQGFSGLVPNDITKYIKDVEIIPQGTWCSFERPAMLRTTSPCFPVIAEKFYRAQREVFGDTSNFFATDPFHEGGKIADLSLKEVAYNVLDSMVKSNPKSVWVIQSWQSNPRSELLEGIAAFENGRDHALILDLNSDKNPNYGNGHEGNPAHGYQREFNLTPWVFCMIGNFGGREGLYGHLTNLAEWIPKAYNTCTKIAGIGITSEATYNNPVLYDFIFEAAWVDNANDKMPVINLHEWLHDYAERRYGGRSEACGKAWDIMLDTVYTPVGDNKAQGAPETIVNARPSLEPRAGSAWGPSVLGYDKNVFKESVKLLIKDYDLLKNSAGYRYDVMAALMQGLCNTAQDIHLAMGNAFKSKDLNEFKKQSAKFLEIIDLMDKTAACNPYSLLGCWIAQARRMAANTDDFTKMLYELNAKSLITTWGSYMQSETGRLHDYSNREWSGLISDFYKHRWERWINDRTKELLGEEFDQKFNWFEWEWKWVRTQKDYPTVPCDPKTILSHVAEVIGIK